MDSSRLISLCPGCERQIVFKACLASPPRQIYFFFMWSFASRLPVPVDRIGFKIEFVPARSFGGV